MTSRAIALAFGTLAVLSAKPVAAQPAPAHAQQPTAPTYWVYDATSDNVTWRTRVWEGGEDTFAGTRAFYLETVTTSLDGDTSVDERSYFVRTPAGVAYLGNRSDSSSGKTHSYDERRQDTPVVVLPSPFALGAKWDASSTSRGDATHGTTSLREVGEVTARETVTVPAGTFECLSVRKTTSAQTTETRGQAVVQRSEISTVTSWYAPSIGLVKETSTTTIQADPATKRDVTKTMVLRSYHVTAPAWQMSAIGFIAASAATPAESPEVSMQRATALAAAGDYASACPLFEASWNASSQLDALVALADCHEHVGKTASAWRELGSAAERAKQAGDPREADARRRADALAPRLAKLHVLPPTRADAGLVIRIDGVDITSTLDAAQPVDPGEHQVSASAPGHQPWATKIVVGGDATTTELPIPPLLDAPAEAAQPAATVAVGSSTDRRAARQMLAVEVALAGAGVVVLGGAFGLAANDKWHSVQSECGGNVTSCSASQIAQAKSDTGNARDLATVSTAMILIGLGAAAAGGVLWLTAPPAAEPARTALRVTPTFDAHSTSVVLSKSW